jgi:hypothetical protein
LTAEDRIHLALLLALGAANFALCARGPGEGPAEPAKTARAAVRVAPTEVTRVELEAAIDRLEGWLARSRTQLPSGAPGALALQSLGPTREDRAQPGRWLAQLLGADMANTWLTPAAGAASAAGGSPRELSAALVVLLEVGVPLEQTLSTAAVEKAPGVKLSELVQRSLDNQDETAPDRADTDPWQLDLLSLAVLGGMSQYRDRLAHSTQRSLRRLDQLQRSQSAQPGAGELDAQQLERLAQAWRLQTGPEPPGALDLHWSAAVFRGTAVLGEADLDAQARRHLNALLSRYHNDRALYRYLESTAGTARERRVLQLAALENLGRFEEALYNAQLTFRSDSGAGPSPYTAQVMRFAARDLIDRLQGLDTRDFELQSAATEQTRDGLLRAAVQALRGLRTARVAG